MIVQGAPVLPPEQVLSLVQESGLFLPGYPEFITHSSPADVSSYTVLKSPS